LRAGPKQFAEPPKPPVDPEADIPPPWESKGHVYGDLHMRWGGCLTFGRNQEILRARRDAWRKSQEEYPDLVDLFCDATLWTAERVGRLFNMKWWRARMAKSEKKAQTSADVKQPETLDNTAFAQAPQPALVCFGVVETAPFATINAVSLNALMGPFGVARCV